MNILRGTGTSLKLNLELGRKKVTIKLSVINGKSYAFDHHDIEKLADYRGIVGSLQNQEIPINQFTFFKWNRDIGGWELCGYEE